MNELESQNPPKLPVALLTGSETLGSWLQDDLASLSDERLVLWYHDIMQDPSSIDSSMRLKLLQEITLRGITVSTILEYTAGKSARILN